ncbi:golgin subfamily B member 1-like [Mus pahari]|uniref:golgin subfamily B member 1-like n=1 Tax=Mus pahari TaxID=10093 RepID=UPI0011148A52|nr:golgin subfamily B member 1-like [Mus pahari]XP_029400149.1 golgin subfamily B member 1-like [Mus pahari]
MASSEAELPQETAMESNNSTHEDDALHRLAEAEKLVVELRDIISQKDVQLQQKDEALQEEKKAAEKKVKNIKLHAKAKILCLNKQLEQMKTQGGAAVPPEAQAKELSKVGGQAANMAPPEPQ